MWQNNKPFLLLLPAVIATGLLFFGGMFYGLVQSIGLAPLEGKAGLTMEHYLKLFSSPDFWRSLTLTFRISMISTLLAALLALFVLYCLFLIRIKSTKDRSVYLQRIFQIPMLFPYIVAAYMIFLMFVQSGWIARILFRAGLIEGMSSFPVMTNESFGWGIIIAYVWKTGPFLVLLLYPVILRVELAWVETARIFGAGNFRMFREIVFPLLISPLERGCLIIFAYTFGAYEVPFILGVTYPKVLAVNSYDIYSGGELSLQPLAMATNIMILFVILLTVGLYFLIKSNSPWKDLERS